MAKGKDKYAQMGYIAVSESGANTLTFGGISVFSNILTPKGLLIHDVKYNVPAASQNLILDEADAVTFGLAGDDTMSAVSLDDAQVYDYNVLGLVVDGAPATSSLIEIPKFIDFSHLPGGGKLVPADRLYAYVQGFSLATPASMNLRFNFTVVDLSAQEYIELAQALRVLT
ncbi:unnamed protein product [marine sediment metagenome]|uniref:Uncharacterized protein n=1 Tax=marine sediment metagenome TaxID=412755 RepID=X0Z9E7_9ZZZZ